YLIPMILFSIKRVGNVSLKRCAGWALLDTIKVCQLIQQKNIYEGRINWSLLIKQLKILNRRNLSAKGSPTPSIRFNTII
ncbi:MAG: hypothetical protein LBC74_12215, partial [Planctomycetaceae bacterium]|nr:hypothetical protein [Planctomycetaceae bacterium]